jgi:hypothetical protein
MDRPDVFQVGGIIGCGLEADEEEHQYNWKEIDTCSERK